MNQLNTLYPHQPTLVPDMKARQGRSTKILRPVVKFDGRVFVARFEGRRGCCFGATEKDATWNLQAGAQ
jgi:hypothetical protein